jgi:hypothetical protein
LTTVSTVLLTLKITAMKKYIFQLLGGVVVIAGLAAYLYQCESDPADMQEMETLATQVNATENAVLTPLCACLNDYPVEKVSLVERNALIFMREEEKLSRDLAMQLDNNWKLRVFENIQKAEQHHMDAIACLMTKYQIPDPVGANPPGTFTNRELQQMYKTMLKEGLQSKQSALLVAAQMEDHDILNVNTLRATVNNEDILKVMDEINKGSRNHLRAYVRNLERYQKVVYRPTYISPEMYQQIINGPWEPGDTYCDTHLYDLAEAEASIE